MRIYWTRWRGEFKRTQKEPVLSVVEGMKLRKQLAEHPFGTIKHHWDQGYFLTRKLPNVGAEINFSVLAYNLWRVINILGVSKMKEALA
jgi:hypothetical protein